MPYITGIFHIITCITPMMQDNDTLPIHHKVTGDAMRSKCTLNLTLAQVRRPDVAPHLAAVVSIL